MFSEYIPVTKTLQMKNDDRDHGVFIKELLSIVGIKRIFYVRSQINIHDLNDLVTGTRETYEI